MRSFIVLLVILVTGCSTSYEKSVFETHTPQGKSWEEFFNDPGDIRVEVWNTGTMTMDYDGVINVKDERAKDLKGKSVDLEVPVYYIKGEGRELIIDTGLGEDFDTNPTRGMGGLLAGLIIKPGKQLDGWSLKERLEGRKLEPEYVFLTHMHFDHIAGIQDLESLPPVITGEGENPINFKFLFESPFLDEVEDLREIDFDKGIDVPPFKNVVDLFGDGTIFAISNKDGHTHGHVTYLLNSASGIYLFPGDQLNIRENIERGVGPGSFSSDLEGAQEHFLNILDFLKKYPETKIMYGHDIEEY